jgi:hypothetical protein
MASKIIASEFTQDQAEAFLKEIGKKSAAGLFDTYLRGECTEGELRGWLLFIDEQRGFTTEQKACSVDCSNAPDSGCWHNLCSKHCRLYHCTNEHSCVPNGK